MKRRGRWHEIHPENSSRGKDLTFVCVFDFVLVLGISIAWLPMAAGIRDGNSENVGRCRADLGTGRVYSQ